MTGCGDGTLPGTDVVTFRQGTHRCVDPLETLEWVRPHLRAMGITRIANITGLDRVGIPVALACRPNSRSLSVSQGKGTTLDAAKASAVMESIELYHAEHIQAPLRLTSYEELQRTNCVVNVAQLPQVKGNTFDKHRRMLWIEGHDLPGHESVWVPYEMVSTDFTLPFPEGFGFFPPNSNGLASGNTWLEAVSHGICEVVERDAVALWTLQNTDQRARCEVELATVIDDVCGELLGKFAAANIEVRVWDLTSDIGLPCFRCSIAERKQDPLHFGYSGRGFGCHPDRSVAMARALTEAAQGRLTYIAGSRDDVSRLGYERMRRTSTTLDALEPETACRRDYAAVPEYGGTTLSDDLEQEVALLKRSGTDRILVVDLTREDFRIPVVKVIIPGLEGVVFESDYTPGTRASRIIET